MVRLGSTIQGDKGIPGRASRQGQEDALLSVEKTKLLSNPSKKEGQSRRVDQDGRRNKPSSRRLTDRKRSGSSRGDASFIEDLEMFNEAIEVVKALSRNKEDIVDMEQRYADLDEVTASRSDYLSLPDDSRDDEWTKEDRDEEATGDDGLASSSSSSSLDDDEEDPSFQEEEEEVKEIHYLDPLDHLMSRFQIKDFMESFQAGNLGTFLLKGKSIDRSEAAAHEEQRRQRQRRRIRSNERMKAELKREIRLADKLERQLEEREQEFVAKMAAQTQKLETLESKLHLQEQIFESQLAAYRETWRGNSDKALLEQVESLKKTIGALETKISELNEQNFWIQQEKASELKVEKQTIEQLQDELFNLEAELDEQRTEYMQLQVLHNKEAFLLECEKRKNQALDRSETHAIVLLLEEQKRAQCLTQINERLRATKLKKNKRRGKHTPQQSTETEEKLLLVLKEKDEQIASIDGVLGHSIASASQATICDPTPAKST